MSNLTQNGMSKTAHETFGFNSKLRILFERARSKVKERKSVYAYCTRHWKRSADWR